MTKKQYRMPNVNVGTVKKSIAAIASRWFLRKVSQRLATSGGLGARRSHRETVGSDRSKPSLSEFTIALERPAQQPNVAPERPAPTLRVASRTITGWLLPRTNSTSQS